MIGRACVMHLLWKQGRTPGHIKALESAIGTLKDESAGNFLVWNLSGEDRFDYHKFDHQVFLSLSLSLFLSLSLSSKTSAARNPLTTTSLTTWREEGVPGFGALDHRLDQRGAADLKCETTPKVLSWELEQGVPSLSWKSPV